jgi:hypothetical protein
MASLSRQLAWPRSPTMLAMPAGSRVPRALGEELVGPTVARLVVTPVAAVEVHLGAAQLLVEVHVRVAEGAGLAADATADLAHGALLEAEHLPRLAVGDEVGPAADRGVRAEDRLGLVEVLGGAHDDVAHRPDGRAAEARGVGEHVLMHGEREARLVHRGDPAEAHARRAHRHVAHALVGRVEEERGVARPVADAVVVEVARVEELSALGRVAPRDGAGAAQAQREAMHHRGPRRLQLHQARRHPEERVRQGAAPHELGEGNARALRETADGVHRERGHRALHLLAHQRLERGDHDLAGGAELALAHQALDVGAVVGDGATPDLVAEERPVLDAHLVKRALQVEHVDAVHRVVCALAVGADAALLGRGGCGGAWSRVVGDGGVRDLGGGVHGVLCDPRGESGAAIA